MKNEEFEVKYNGKKKRDNGEHEERKM